MQMLDTSFDLRALLDSCCSIVEGQIVDRHMTFTKQIGPFWHPYLIGSELHIRQVLINILSNAVKYTPDGGEINFRAKETLFEEGLVHLRMEIKDNGIGMSEEFLQHIFEPFTQEQRSSRTHYKGRRVWAWPSQRSSLTRCTARSMSRVSPARVRPSSP